MRRERQKQKHFHCCRHLRNVHCVNVANWISDLDGGQRLPKPLWSVTASTCQCINVSMCQCVNVPMCRCVSVSMCHFVNVSLHQRINVSMCQCVAVSMCQCLNLSMCQCVNASAMCSVLRAGDGAVAHRCVAHAAVVAAMVGSIHLDM